MRRFTPTRGSSHLVNPDTGSGRYHVPILVAYISGHGFGHASRTIEVLNAVARRRPDVRIQVRTTVAPWLFARTAAPQVEVQAVECDTGAVQIDSLHVDVAATIRAAETFMAGFEARVAAESAELQAIGANLVLADAPALGIASGRRAGAPAVLLGNFTWDWIYAAYPGGAGLAERLGAVYAESDLALRLPLHGGFATCPRVRDLPFVARRSRRTREAVRRYLGLSSEAPVVLLSFGGYGLQGLDLEQLTTLSPYRILVSDQTRWRGGVLQEARDTGAVVPLDEAGLYASGFRYEDVVHAADVVVTKPGYGIIAECAANDTAIVYTSRGAFAEYEVLVAGMPRVLRTAFIDNQQLLAGEWQAALDAVLAQAAPPEQADVSGADVAADVLLSMM